MTWPPIAVVRHAAPSFARAPWITLLLAVAVLGLRAWFAPSSVFVDDLRTHSLSGVAWIWAWGSCFLLGVGGLLSAVPVAPDLSRVGRLAWSWALWSSFVAAVPPRPSNFFANGATDDDLFVYGPAALVSVGCSWALARTRHRNSLAAQAIAFGVLSAAGAALFWFSGGPGRDGVVLASFVAAACSWLLSGGVALAMHLQRSGAGG